MHFSDVVAKGVMMALIFIDCEAVGGCPRLGQLAEFGAVEFETRSIFHGKIVKSRPSKENPAIPELLEQVDLIHEGKVFHDFAVWLKAFSGNGRPVMISDNPAYDYQWINDGFWRHLGYNPLGHSARRIGDFYAGLKEDYRNTQSWKRLRATKHDHNPVNDAMGNAEAFKAMLDGER